MEGAAGQIFAILIVLVVLAAVAAYAWRRPLGWEHANNRPMSKPADIPKSSVFAAVLDGLEGKTYSDLGGTHYWYIIGEPPEVFTLFTDIDQFAHIRRHRGLWDFQGVHGEREIEGRWRRQPASKRIWDAVQLVVPPAIRAAFGADSRIRTVRFHIGNMDVNDRISTCRISVEAKRGEREQQWDWRYNRNAKGQLAPVNPHEDAPAPVRPRGFAADPYDFEMQVAQALQARGLSVEVTGGAGDEGVDIIARDPTPVTGGTYLVQCKRYAIGRKVGVGEVRELYGALQEKRASKGILVTTASFTIPAIRFAEDKPIELLDGAQLAAFIGEPAPAPDDFRKQDPLDDDKEWARDLMRRFAMDQSSEPDLGSALHRAIGIEQALQERGLSVEADEFAQVLDSMVSMPDDRGLTALHVADTPAVAALLLDRGADIEARAHYSWTPLHHVAALDKDPAVAALLLDRGADIEAATDNGSRPLHLAAGSNNEPAVAALLLDRGRGHTRKRRRGRDALAPCGRSICCRPPP